MEIIWSKGAKVFIGGKYAEACSYKSAVGKHAVILEEVGVLRDPYRLNGDHRIYYVQVTDAAGRTFSWEVHADDCLPVANKEQKHILAKYDD